MAVIAARHALERANVDRAEVDLPSLEGQLTALHHQDPDIAVHLNADQAVNYGLVAKAMSAVDRAGVTKLSVLTANESAHEPASSSHLVTATRVSRATDSALRSRSGDVTVCAV